MSARVCRVPTRRALRVDPTGATEPMEELKAVMGTLIAGKPLEGHHRDHELSGGWKRHRDGHVRSDWVLIYRIDGDVTTFERTGTHADLFD